MRNISEMEYEDARLTEVTHGGVVFELLLCHAFTWFPVSNHYIVDYDGTDLRVSAPLWLMLRDEVRAYQQEQRCARELSTLFAR